MINQGNNVPDKTIVVFNDSKKNPLLPIEKDRLKNILDVPLKQRSWFTPHFYKCLPLVIGNQYGFIVKSEFDIGFIWNGGDSPNSIKIYYNKTNQVLDTKYPRIETHFGNGIITINPPFALRTPPGVNLMTINPPNYIVPNITVMTGVVETDNIRKNFTFNLKIQIPNIRVDIPAGYPLAAFIPIPRYYADSFELKMAEEVFTQEVIDEEIQASLDADIFREDVEPTLPNEVGRQYLKGEDVYGNKFTDHQKT
jgi:hypothetical protein